MTDHFIKLDLLMIDIHRLIMTNLGYNLLQVLKTVSKKIILDYTRMLNIKMTLTSIRQNYTVKNDII